MTREEFLLVASLMGLQFKGAPRIYQLGVYHHGSWLCYVELDRGGRTNWGDILETLKGKLYDT